MYKPPENSNRVKAIKSKFENNADENGVQTKPPLRKSKTLHDFKISKTNIQQDKIQSNTKENNVESRGNQQNLSRQLSDPTKRNIKRSPAFRLDKSSESTNARFLQNKTRYLEKIAKSNHAHDENNEGASQDKTNEMYSSFSDLRNMFNGNSKVPVNITQLGDKIESDIIPNNFKFLYSEPVPKSQRNKIDIENFPKDLHNVSTLKISDSHVNDITNITDKNSTKNNAKYGSLNVRSNVRLTDTLRNALKKPLPPGPAPKKPPRTFVHTPNETNLSNEHELTHLNLNTNFTKKLNSELQKNIVVLNKKSKGDPKYMLDKLETALKSKGILMRKYIRSGNTSEDDSDNEKHKLLNLRDLPTIPSSHSTTPNLYATPEVSPKFNFNCLPSLSCTHSSYSAIKEPNSSFFIACNKEEEPVYAEPFEYQLDIEENKNCDDSSSAIDSSAGEPGGRKAVRRSVHYASSPVPDLKMEEGNNHVSEVKVQDQMFYCVESSPSSTTTTSDMESIVSTPSEESKNLLSVKDLVKAIETNSSTKSQISITKSNPIPIKTQRNNRIDDLTLSYDHVKQFQNQIKTLEKSFITRSEGNIADLSLTEDDNEDKQQISKFESYVRKIRHKIKLLTPNKDRLFHCCLLVALNRTTPYVKSKFPSTVQEPFRIADLCFPEVENGCMDTSIEAQCYSLIITNEHGERTFGYCRRVLPEASTACLPLAYCILSKHKAPGFYRKVLEELEHHHGFPDKFIDAFIKELYCCKFPKPGETMIIDCSKIVSSAGCDKIKLHVPSDFNNSDNSTNSSEHNSNICDKNDLLDSMKNTSHNENDDEKELDLNSFVVVCNRGEYGTLIRNNPIQNSLNNTRGTSAIISLPREISPSQLKRSTSSPNLLADIESLPSELVLTRPTDSRHEENDLMLLGTTLKMPVLLKVFGSLLLERKVILVSSVLSKLSSCIEALQITLYPFSWQHTIIPVLPRSLWEIVDTPTPLLCGVLSAEVAKDYVIENGIVVDLDKGVVLLEMGDENKILPLCLIRTLKDGLDLASRITDNSGAHNIFFSDAFIRIFIYSCGHYKDHTINGIFNKAVFIQQGRHKRKIKGFLKWFTETTMFYNFIELALNKSSSLHLFDQRIQIYESDSAADILNKMKSKATYRGLLSPNLIKFQ